MRIIKIIFLLSASPFMLGISNSNLMANNAKIEHYTYPLGKKNYVDYERFVIDQKPYTLNDMCQFVYLNGKTKLRKTQALEIKDLNVSANLWDDISLFNGIVGVLVMFGGAGWWVASGEPWLFSIGLAQHGTAYITGYYSNDLKQQAVDRSKDLIHSYNESLKIKSENIRGLAIHYRF